MHELSVATALVAQAEHAARAAGVGPVVAVRVRLGRLSGLVPHALEYGFTVAARGTTLEGARLDVERVEPVVWCAPCGAAVELASPTRFRCPDCDTPSGELLAGRELQLRALEIEDAPVGSPA
jgi:hydrogenase nickel incorporation protein HypA/HybF